MRMESKNDLQDLQPPNNIDRLASVATTVTSKSDQSFGVGLSAEDADEFEFLPLPELEEDFIDDQDYEHYTSNEVVGRIPFSSTHDEPLPFSSPNRRCFLPGQKVTVKVVDVLTPDHSKLLNPYLYVIEITHGEYKWTIRKRHKHFMQLHEQLLLFKTKAKIPLPTRDQRQRRKSFAARKQDLPAFPKTLDPLVDDLDKRKKNIENYLQGVVRCTQFRNHPETLKLFEVSNLSFVSQLGQKRREGFVQKRSGGRRINLGCCGCFKNPKCGRHWNHRWLILKDTFVCYIRPKEGSVRDLLMMDEDFYVEVGRANTGIKHGLRISNLSRHLALRCWTHRKAQEWKDAIDDASKQAIDFTQQNRYDAFAPPREDIPSKWFVDGGSYMAAAADALESAKEEIFITDWWLSPEVYMKRPATADQYWRLDVILARKAAQGVKIFVLLYKEMQMALGINSFYTKATLISLHSANVKVLRDPDGINLWSHHEKSIIIDQRIAFLGGIDLCYGRWDTPSHRLNDLGTSTPLTSMPGFENGHIHFHLGEGDMTMNTRAGEQDQAKMMAEMKRQMSVNNENNAQSDSYDSDSSDTNSYSDGWDSDNSYEYKHKNRDRKSSGVTFGDVKKDATDGGSKQDEIIIPQKQLFFHSKRPQAGQEENTVTPEGGAPRGDTPEGGGEDVNAKRKKKKKKNRSKDARPNSQHIPAQHTIPKSDKRKVPFNRAMSVPTNPDAFISSSQTKSAHKLLEMAKQKSEEKSSPDMVEESQFVFNETCESTNSHTKLTGSSSHPGYGATAESTVHVETNVVVSSEEPSPLNEIKEEEESSEDEHDFEELKVPADASEGYHNESFDSTEYEKEFANNDSRGHLNESFNSEEYEKEFASNKSSRSIEDTVDSVNVQVEVRDNNNDTKDNKNVDKGEDTDEEKDHVPDLKPAKGRSLFKEKMEKLSRKASTESTDSTTSSSSQGEPKAFKDYVKLIIANENLRHELTNDNMTEIDLQSLSESQQVPAMATNDASSITNSTSSSGQRRGILKKSKPPKLDLTNMTRSEPVRKMFEPDLEDPHQLPLAMHKLTTFQEVGAFILASQKATKDAPVQKPSTPKPKKKIVQKAQNFKADMKEKFLKNRSQSVDVQNKHRIDPGIDLNLAAEAMKYTKVSGETFLEEADKQGARLWIGKDYVNFIYKDLVQLDEPFTDFISREQTPRMPWHDIGAVVYGKCARDVARHFIQRWNFTKLQKQKTNAGYPILIPKSYKRVTIPSSVYTDPNTHIGRCQILRSSCQWSAGIHKVESSIHNAYIDMIKNAQHFIYIENQFFISIAHNPVVENRIADALYERIMQAHRNNEKFRVYVVLPLLPAFEGELGTPTGTSIQAVTHWNYSSICKGPHSLLARLLASKVQTPFEYISFYGLRTHGDLCGSLVSELVYVHCKIMIIDDRKVIIGSANINDRSMLGKRDSELAIVTEPGDVQQMINGTMNGKPWKAGRFAHSLRMALMKEHLGVTDANKEDIKNLADPVSNTVYKRMWMNQAAINTSIYEKVFNCIPSDEVKSIAQLKEYQSKTPLAQSDPDLSREKLKRVKGHLVLLPLHFLSSENLSPALGTKESLAPTVVWT